MSQKLGVLDLFSGAGGFSNGFEQAGFEIVSAVEYDEKIAKTYSYNHPNTILYNKDIREISIKEIQDNFKLKKANIDVIVGGPPCQGFSMSGRRIRKKGKFLEDERNFLFLEFHKFVKILKPKFFIIENVPGILNYNDTAIKEEIYSLFSDDYAIDCKVLNAADYGVPQLRKRAFFIGSQNKQHKDKLFPTPTHTPEKYITLWEAISNLPQIKNGEGEEKIPANNLTPQTKYQKTLSAKKSDFVYNHTSSKHKNETLKKLEQIKIGQRQADLPKNLQTKSVHSGSYGRMHVNKPAFTLTTRINTPSVGRIVHPYLNRTITPREAARIQSFPDDFRFIGNITTVGMQIGNAVPPILAKSLAEHLKKLTSDF